MKSVDETAKYMREHHLVLTTGESCTAGLIAARLADVPGAGKLLDCAFVVYSPQAKEQCLAVDPDTVERAGLTSEAVAREMALGALGRGRANVAIANTGVTEQMPDGPPAGTQCFAWAFSNADGASAVFTETQRFEGNRNDIRQAAAEFALERLPEYHAQWQNSRGCT